MTCAGAESQGAELGCCLLPQLGFGSGDGVGSGSTDSKKASAGTISDGCFHQPTLNSAPCLSFPTGIMTAIIFLSTRAGVEGMVRSQVCEINSCGQNPAVL